MDWFSVWFREKISNDSIHLFNANKSIRCIIKISGNKVLVAKLMSWFPLKRPLPTQEGSSMRFQDDVVARKQLHALLAICEEKLLVTGGFPSQRAINVELKQTVELRSSGAGIIRIWNVTWRVIYLDDTWYHTVATIWCGMIWYDMIFINYAIKGNLRFTGVRLDGCPSNVTWLYSITCMTR